MSAIELNARASSNFVEKLAETQALLQRAAKEFTPITQASSLGAEDIVITHLINSLQLGIPVFVLETGALHHETLALLERTQAHSQRRPRRHFQKHGATQSLLPYSQDGTFVTRTQRATRLDNWAAQRAIASPCRCAIDRHLGRSQRH